AEIDQFLSAQLRHHVNNTDRVAGSGELDRWAYGVYRIIEGFARGQAQDAATFATLDRIRDELDRTSDIYGPVVREQEMEMALERAREKAELEERVREQQGRTSEQAAALASMEQRANRAETDAKNRAGRLLALQNENDKLQSRILEQMERVTQ